MEGARERLSRPVPYTEYRGRIQDFPKGGGFNLNLNVP